MNFLRRLLAGRWSRAAGDSASREDDAPQYTFQWYEPGPENPLGVRFLDCRSFTQSVISVTKDPAIAERYVALRGSDGRDLIAEPIADSIRVATSLTFPRNGAPLEGIVFKSPAMEVKWGIYIYDSVFLLARSWTGGLLFRAFATIGATEIFVHEIECLPADREIAASHIYFLLGTHALGRVLPHRLPPATPAEPMTMATLSLSLFGKLACYAKFEDITQIPLS